MPKPKNPTVQLRIPADVASDLDIIASAFGLEANEYLTQLAREGIARDIDKASEIVKARAVAARAGQKSRSSSHKEREP